MNSVVETILRRHSVREGFSSEPVPVEILWDIVQCGLAAPSSKNARPWTLHVVTDRLLLGEVAGFVETSEGIDTYVPFDPATGLPRPEWSSSVIESAAVLKSVPVAIFIENMGVFSGGRGALLGAAADALARSIVGYTFEAMGVGAALQNMWIAAVAHGLAGVFLGDVLIAEHRIQHRLGCGHDLAGVLALGYPEARQTHALRSLQERGDARVHWLSPG